MDKPSNQKSGRAEGNVIPEETGEPLPLPDEEEHGEPLAPPPCSGEMLEMMKTMMSRQDMIIDRLGKVKDGMKMLKKNNKGKDKLEEDEDGVDEDHVDDESEYHSVSLEREDGNLYFGEGTSQRFPIPPASLPSLVAASLVPASSPSPVAFSGTSIFAFSGSSTSSGTSIFAFSGSSTYSGTSIFAFSCSSTSSSTREMKDKIFCQVRAFCGTREGGKAGE